MIAVGRWLVFGTAALFFGCSAGERSAAADAGSGEEGTRGGGPAGAEDASDGDAVPATICTPFERRCGIGTTDVVGICGESGTVWLEEECGPGRSCLDGECLDQTCSPGAAVGGCLDGEDAYPACDELGLGIGTKVCAAGERCLDGAGGAGCSGPICEPGEILCNGFFDRQVCTADGFAWEGLEGCPKGLLCVHGVCESTCGYGIMQLPGDTTCDWWLFDPGPSVGGGARAAMFRPDEWLSLAAFLENASGAELPDSLWTPSGSGFETFLPADGGPSVWRFHHPARALAWVATGDGKGGASEAARRVSTSAVFGSSLRVVAWPDSPSGGGPAATWIAVAATYDSDSVEIEVSPAAPLLDGGVVREEPFETVLAKGGLLRLVSVDGGDLSGTRIQSSHEVVVYAGLEAAPGRAPSLDAMPAEPRWGRDYVAVPFPAPGAQVVRLLGGSEGGAVGTTAPTFESFSLPPAPAAGVEIPAPAPFAVEGESKLLAHSTWKGSAGPGCDEAVASVALVPVQRWSFGSTVFVPEGYEAAWLSIVSEGDAPVTLDGTAVESVPALVAGTDYAIRTLEVAPGFHTAQSESQLTTLAWGVGCDGAFGLTGLAH